MAPSVQRCPPENKNKVDSCPSPLLSASTPPCNEHSLGSLGLWSTNQAKTVHMCVYAPETSVLADENLEHCEEIVLENHS
mmetsp:Transcript_48189/g.79364  ORF Transcript_48189/g.79364 Transcript_48189/m.79364 type:complete len:80 (-) Transcript_48189:3-242(-)